MNPYDAVPYVGGSFRHTHADHLRTIAGLFGIESAPARQCRVLELGCAAGVNLRQMAQAAPESEFVGIDGSAVLQAMIKPRDLFQRLSINEALFPRGIDVVLVHDDNIVAIPRTTRLIASGV